MGRWLRGSEREQSACAATHALLGALAQAAGAELVEKGPAAWGKHLLAVQNARLETCVLPTVWLWENPLTSLGVCCLTRNWGS